MNNTCTKLAMADTLAAIGATTFAAEPTTNQLAPYGYPASGTAGSRVVNLGSESKSLNVTQSETIQLNVNGRITTWTFDTLGTTSFPLTKIIPGADGVTVYVAKNPLYRGAGR